MNNIILNEAFLALNILNEEDFDLKGDFQTELTDFFDEDSDVDADVVDVVDLDAEEEDELSGNNIGKIILQCPVCQSIIMVDADKIDLPEDEDSSDEQLVQVDESCPVCFSEDGYKIIGKVAPYEETTIEITDKDDDTEETDVEDDIDVDAEEDTEDSDTDEDDAEEDEVDDEEKDDVDESLTEDLNNIEFDTGSEHVSIKSEEIPDKEMIAPLDVADAQEIADANAPEEDSPVEDALGTEEDSDSDAFGDDGFGAEGMETTDLGTEDEELPVEENEDDNKNIDVDDFDETAFESLQTGYLKQVYDNVDSFKTTAVKSHANGNLIVEGVINFTSGSKKKTRFILEGENVDRQNNCTILAENYEITPGKKAFSLTGNILENKLTFSSMKYQYEDNGANIFGETKI